MKSFISAAADEAERDDAQDESWPFTLDEGNPKYERELVAYKPSDPQIALLMAETGRHADVRTKVSGAMDFFLAVFEDDDAAYLRNRLLDRKDDFGMPTVQEIIEWLLGEWSGHPTDGPSGSTRSRSNGGPRSKQRTPAST